MCLVEQFSSVAALVAVLELPKRLITPCYWIESKQPGQRGLRLRASLHDRVAALRGVSVEICCSSEGFDLPSRVLLIAEVSGKPRPFARIDINGSRHSNRALICGIWQHIDAGHTHFHDTRLHLELTLEQLFGSDWDLPVARPIPDLPTEFTKAMEKCGELLHIENLHEVEEPQWQPKRFPF